MLTTQCRSERSEEPLRLPQRPFVTLRESRLDARKVS